MRTLKEIRLVYRQHLLPPLIVPFQKLSDYKKVLGDNSVKKNAKEQYMNEINKLQEVNETVITQIIKIRSNFIEPLQLCPFYYDYLDIFIRKNISSQNQNKQYQKLAFSIQPMQRINIFKRFKREYKKFIKEMDTSLSNSITFVPIFPYYSFQDYLLSQNRRQDELNQVQKGKLRQAYDKKVQIYWKSLHKIAENQSIRVQQLIEITKNQIEPQISTGLKRLLFPSIQF